MIITKMPKIKYQKSLVFNSFNRILDSIEEIDFSEIEEVVAVISKKGVLFELNVTSAVFWELLDEYSNLDKISQTMSCIFEASQDVILEDISILARELLEQGLVHVD